MLPQVQQFLLKLPEKKRILAIELRDIILSAESIIAEAIKWRQLTFVSGKTNIAFIYTYQNVEYINVGFMQATSLNDPKKLFEGTGKGMRHIKVYTPKDISAMQLKKWVQEAVLLTKMLT